MAAPYDPTEDPDTAFYRRMSYLGEPDDLRRIGSLYHDFAETCLGQYEHKGMVRKSAYRAMRQNALRILIAPPPICK